MKIGHAKLPLSLGAVFVAAMLIAGCDTLNWQQYRVAGVSAGSSDADKLARIVTRVGKRFGLEDQTSKALVPETLIFVIEPGDSFRTEIGARFYQQDAIVDVYAGFGPRIRKQQRVSRALGSELTAAFGARCIASTPEQRLPTR